MVVIHEISCIATTMSFVRMHKSDYAVSEYAMHDGFGNAVDDQLYAQMLGWA